MSCKTVKTQAELDAALADSDVTCVHIESEKGVWLRVGSSGSATVRAYGSATVEASGSATVEASGSATVRAYGSATVEAYGSATVEASGSATVEASGATAITVPRYSEANVTAGPHAAVHLHSGAATVTGGVLIDLTQVDLKQAAAWCEHNGVEVVDGRAVLHKALGDDLTAGGDYGSPVVYEVGAELVCADWLDSNECGGGLHLSPRPLQAARYRDGATRFLRCTVALEDVRPILDSTPKCKVRALRVESEVDRFGRPLPVPEPVGA